MTQLLVSEGGSSIKRWFLWKDLLGLSQRFAIYHLVFIRYVLDYVLLFIHLFILVYMEGCTCIYSIYI